MRSPDAAPPSDRDLARFRGALDALRGDAPWRLVAGKGTGSAFTLSFAGGYTLRVFCGQTGDEGNWCPFSPAGLFGVGDPGLLAHDPDVR